MLTDMHCHILPGVDDGARTIEESVRMLTAAKAIGFRRIFATPHAYHLRRDRIKQINAYQALNRHALEMGVELRLGYEVNWRAIVSADWNAISSLVLEGTDKLLLELPNRALFPSWELLIPEMCSRMKLVIAHPERYVYFQKNIALYDKLRDAGCEMQIDACALVGSCFFAETHFARHLLKTGRVDYVATDAHSDGDYAAFSRARSRFREYWPAR